MQTFHDEIAFDGNYLSLIRRHFRDRNGDMQTWEFVQRKEFGPIVSVLGLTDNHEYILIKNFRIPLKKYVIEFCAGLMDKEGESPEDAARREFLEETGYSLKSIRKIFSGPYNSGMQSSQIVFFLGIGAKKVQAQKLDTVEEIEVLKIPIEKSYEYLMNPPEDVLVDMKIFSALYFTERLYRDIHSKHTS